MNDKPFDFRKIVEGTMSYIALKTGWGLLVPMPILILSFPLWWVILPLSVQNKIDIDPSTISIYWWIGIAAISVTLGFFCRWLAFGVLSENRFRIIIYASLTALSGIISLGFAIVWTIIFYRDPEIFDLGMAVKNGVSATYEFLMLAGFLWLIFSKKKN